MEREGAERKRGKGIKKEGKERKEKQERKEKRYEKTYKVIRRD